MDTNENVLAFISEELRVKTDELLSDTSLFHDLGVDGDDAADFLFAYSKKFGVNCDNFKFDDHFGNEASLSIGSLLSKGLNKSSKKRLTVGKLIKAAESGSLS